MPTTASSNHPHVRITPETHKKIRLLAFIEEKSQGDLVDELVTERLAAIGNPQIHVPSRQKPKEATAESAPATAERPLSPRRKKLPRVEQ